MRGVGLSIAALLVMLLFAGGGRSQTVRAGYVGDVACATCHQQQATGFVHTAHHLTSAAATRSSVLGPLTDGKNILKISDPAPAIEDPGVHYLVAEMNGTVSLEAFTGFEGNWEVRKERMDLVVGSGVRGQSYLFWQTNKLFELPVSYWREGNQWINSPGYRNGPPIFDRAATPRCLECHFSYAKSLDTDWSANRYASASIQTGITCEVCHGPGARHAELHRQTSSAGTKLVDEAIINTGKQTRDLQVAMCALCHSGASRPLLSPAFSYRPGEPLSSHLGANAGAVKQIDARPDVHADQVGLLQRSRCYVKSPGMSCSTCHDVHAPEQQAADYSSRCLTCHVVSSCGKFKTLGDQIAKDCIGCHMPVQQTNAIVSETGDKVLRTSMRTHWIKVYDAAADPH